MEVSAPATVFSKSQSANTSIGDLPPSSSVTGISFSAAALATMRPTSTLPVNVTLRTFGCATSGPPHSGPKPDSMLKQPGGRMRFTSSHTRSTVSGASSADFTTTVLPATSAGATFSAISSMRHVPRDDGADHAQRLAHRHGQHVGRERHALALQLAAQAAEELEDVGDGVRLDPALRPQRLAGLERDQPGQLLHVLAQQRGALADQRAALAGRHPGPGLLRRVGDPRRRRPRPPRPPRPRGRPPPRSPG